MSQLIRSSDSQTASSLRMIAFCPSSSAGSWSIHARPVMMVSLIWARTEKGGRDAG
jgi:hypothetical protein